MRVPKKLAVRLCCTAVIVLVASVLFNLLYLFDNKYTAPGTQAIGGVLFLSQEELEKNPIRYLWNGWDFYENELLTPASYKTTQTIPKNIAIGQYGNFGMDTGSNIHGCGTYVMNIVLPSTTESFAIELPEIYSAYTMYINDRLVMSMGDPTDEGYTESIQSRAVVFEASGSITLLIAVSDKSHFYSGLIYPPAFGDVLTVNIQRGLRMSVSLCFTVVCLLFAGLSLYIFLRTKRRNSGILVAMCAVTGVFVAHAAIHSFVKVAAHPWYTIELVSGYAAILLIVVMHNRVCGQGKLVSRISEIVAAAFCVAAVCYGCFSASLTMPVVTAFSHAVMLFKIAVSLYLALTALMALGRGRVFSTPLFYADIFYVCALFWDYMLPNFEPIAIGWFQEWGCIVLVAVHGCLLWYDMAVGYRKSIALSEERRQMQRMLDMQKEHYRKLTEQIEQTRRMRHDFRQHLRTIMSMAENGGDVSKYIRGISNIGTILHQLSFCENAAVDALISYYYTIAKQNGIAFYAKISAEENIPVGDVELCTIIGNLLENANEACNRMTGEQRRISIKGSAQEDGFYLVVENTFEGELLKTGGVFLSRKHTGEGIGLESIKEVTKSLGGTCRIETSDGIFKVSLVLPFHK